MTLLALRMLFRKGETASAVLAVALLVAHPSLREPRMQRKRERDVQEARNHYAGEIIFAEDKIKIKV